MNLPSGATTLLGLIAGVLAALNQTVFHLGNPWGEYVTIALTFLAALSISPLLGAQFRSALHLSHTVSVLISAAVAALAISLTTLSVSHDTKALIEGILSFLAAIGFAPATGLALRSRAAAPPPAV